MKVETKLQGVDETLGLLRALPPEIVSKRGGPVRAALRKGAMVIHRQAVANLQAATNNATPSSEEKLSTGFLKQNVVVTRGKEPTGVKGERYLVRVRRKGYHGRSEGTGKKAKGVTTLQTGQLLEYGSSQQPAEPWLRPAFASRAQQAINVATEHVATAVDRLAKKHLRKAG